MPLPNDEAKGPAVVTDDSVRTVVIHRKCFSSLLVATTTIAGGCATDPKIVLPPPEADPLERAHAFRSYQVNSILEDEQGVTWLPHRQFRARLNNDLIIVHPGHLARTVPSSERMRRYDRRYRGLRIASWISLPLAIASLVIGGVLLSRSQPVDSEDQSNPRYRKLGFVGLGSGLALGAGHLLFYDMAAINAHNAFEHYNEALESELRLRRKQVGPKYIQDNRE